MHTDRPMNEPFVEEKTKQIDCDSGMDAEFRKGLEILPDGKQ